MKKSVGEMIFDKFADKIINDASFKGISSDLIAVVTQKKPKRTEIEELLRKQHDEDIESRD
ncbi:MAG: hypothetical protein HZC47_05250 [Methanobacterium sp.]|uniref:hypothetical protein n=1 Tax=Methanobacterium sp. TaxID=2164 RepID=UPI003D648E9D|nr:hypothetical protein [Methanobacterium sp.]